MIATQYGFSIMQRQEVLFISPFQYPTKLQAHRALRTKARSMNLPLGRNHVVGMIESEAVGPDTRHYAWMYNGRDEPIGSTPYTPLWGPDSPRPDRGRV